MSSLDKHKCVGQISSNRTEDTIAHGRLSGTALSLLHNPIAALQECIEEEIADTRDRAAALQALNSVKELLLSVAAGSPVNANDFDKVMAESHAVFVSSGRLDYPVAEWCINTLYEGMANIGRDESECCKN
jgi:hypothetical protein